MKKQIAIAILAITEHVLGQTSINLKTQARNSDFATFSFTRPLSVGAALPSTCQAGQLFFNTSAPAGNNIYDCINSNTWSQVGYTLPQATATTLGGVTIPQKSGLNIAAGGLSVIYGTGANTALQGSSLGQANGAASLDASGQIPIAQLRNLGSSAFLNATAFDAAGTAAAAVAAIPVSGASVTHPSLITPSDWAAFAGKQPALGFIAENSANKGQAGGYAALNTSGQVPSSQLPAIPNKVSQLTNDSGFITAGQAASAAPVQSVNNQTGAITISVPSKISQLLNDAGFITSATAPVTSVNGQTGAVSVPTGGGYSAYFPAETNLVIPAAVHGQGALAVVTGCVDNSIAPKTIVLDGVVNSWRRSRGGDIFVTFSTPVAGVCNIQGSGGSTGSGTIYYVDIVSGSDSNNGTSTSTPWRTVAKINSSTFGSGDQILFKRGGTWSGTTLIPPSSGTAAAPIVFSAYGNGPDPILDGQNTLFSLIQPNNMTGLVFDHLQIRNATSHLVYSTSCSQCTFQNLTMYNSPGHALYFTGTTGANPGLTVLNSTYSTAAGLTTAGMAVVYATSCDGANISGNGFTLYGDVKSYGVTLIDCSGAAIAYNTISNGDQEISINAAHENVTGVSIHDNQLLNTSTIGGGDGEALELTGCSTTSSPGCPSPDSANTHPVSANVYGNYCATSVNDCFGLFVTQNAALYNNLIVSPGTYGIHATSGVNGDLFYNNDIYAPTNSGITIDDTGSTVTVALRNNIVSNAPGHCLWLGNGSLGTEDYNICYNSGANAGFTAGAHDKTNNPLWVNGTPGSPNDFKLQSGSPAIDSGANLGAPYNMALDPSSSSIPLSSLDQNTVGAAWEIGAYVYVPAAVAPVAAPTIAAGSGAGNSSSVLITGDNQSGRIVLTTGSSPAGSTSVGTVTFSGALQSTPNCSVFPNSTSAALLTGSALVYAANDSLTSYQLVVGSTPLAASTQYSWKYQCLR